jgi:eukaryotic-like serine/threonine-protein kinase
MEEVPPACRRDFFVSGPGCRDHAKRMPPCPLLRAPKPSRISFRMTTDEIARLNASLSGRYVIERAIGQGANAIVYLARDIRHDRRVAIKVLRPEIAELVGGVRFQREIEIVARLSHPHILPLFDSGVADKLFFYVTPFVEGESLREHLSRRGQLPLVDARRFGEQIASALDFAHRQGIVHRDVKPENVLIHDNRAIIADFGIATVIGDTARLTQAGMAVGTPAYMSPEQWAGDAVDLRADVYSLGCVVFEMLTGRGPHAAAAGENPGDTLRHVRPDVPADVQVAVARALAPRPENRQSSTAELGASLAITTETTKAARSRFPENARRWAAVMAGLILVSVAIWKASSGTRNGSLENPTVTTAGSPAGALAPAPHGGGSTAAQSLMTTDAQVMRRAQKIETALLPEMRRLADEGKWGEAFEVSLRLQGALAGDDAFETTRFVFADTVPIETVPSGATVYWKRYEDTTDQWTRLGTTPLVAVLPREPAISRLKLEKAGYRPVLDVERALFRRYIARRAISYALISNSDDVPGMAYFDSTRAFSLDILPGMQGISTANLRPFWLDSRETTNQEFQAFVDAGGYSRAEYWTEPFVEQGRTLSWDQAMRLFVDRTGRPGPATWQGGQFPAGQGSHPVSGVSWFEAMAYARYAGKALPTLYHWARAAAPFAAGSIISASNIGKVDGGTAPVGANRGVAAGGVTDIVGNVREWVYNAAPDGRYIVGGAFDDATFRAFEPGRRSPFDRSPANGFRLARFIGSPLPRAFAALSPGARDYRTELPVPDETLNGYMRLFDYDRTPLNVRLERSDSTAELIRELVSFDAAYGSERMAAWVYRPRKGRPPFQTVLFFPGSGAVVQENSDQMSTSIFDFLVRDGRIVVHPILKGTFERQIPGLRQSDPNETQAYLENVVAWVKDVRRTTDYLASRADVDTARLGYFGHSWGGRLASITLSVDSRFKAAALLVAGYNARRAKPEVDDFNYTSRVRIPVLMMNGRYDVITPNARVMFERLGTPAKDKHFFIADGGHYVPPPDMIRETLAWFDRYLGPVRRK